MTPPPEGWRAQLPGSPAAQRRLGALAATAFEAHEALVETRPMRLHA